jgi:hypothetical protein
VGARRAHEHMFARTDVDAHGLFTFEVVDERGAEAN